MPSEPTPATLGPEAPAESVPRWRQVSDDLRRRCREGDFASGVPGETSLAVEYEVSRHTVREALRPLREQGVIRSQRGRPSTVRIEDDSGSITDLLADWSNAGVVASRRVDSTGSEGADGTFSIRAILADDVDARLLACPVGTPLLIVRVRRTEPDRSPTLEEILIRGDRLEVRAPLATGLALQVLETVRPAQGRTV